MHPAATPTAPEPQPTRRRLLALTAPVLVALTGSVVMLNPPPAWGQAAGAAAATRPDDELATAFERFDQAGPANHAAVDDAAERFARLSAARPADPVLRAYAGASTSMRATTTLLPWRKMTYAEDGLALIDKALAQLTPAHDAPAHQGVPASLETRFVAASTFLGLPGMFNRNERGAKLLGEVVRSPLLDASPLSFRASVWMTAGNEAAKAKRADEARQWWQKVAGSGAPQADKAQARIKAL